jgi:hypothetical protein
MKKVKASLHSGAGEDDVCRIYDIYNKGSLTQQYFWRNNKIDTNVSTFCFYLLLTLRVNSKIVQKTRKKTSKNIIWIHIEIMTQFN